MVDNARPRGASVRRAGSGALHDLVEAAPEGAPVVGMVDGDVAVAVELDEFPHVLISGPTGSGRSSLARLLVAQLMRHGATVSVIDVKRRSQRWLRGLAGVDYWTDPGEIHAGLVGLGEELQRRGGAADAEAPGSARRHVVLVDETAITIELLREHWRSIRTEGDERQSPAIKAFGHVMISGRQVRIHVVAIGSMTTTSVALALRGWGTSLRDCFGVVIFAGATTRRQLEALAPEVDAVPVPSRRRGQATVVCGGVARDAQVVFFTEAYAAAWATGREGLHG